MLGQSEAVRFLRYFWIAKYEEVSKQKLYDKYRDHIETMKPQEAVEFARELRSKAEVYRHFAAPGKPGSCPWDDASGCVSARLKRLKTFRLVSCRPALMACAEHCPRQMERLTAACESIALRYLMVGELNPSPLESAFAAAAAAVRDGSEDPVGVLGSAIDVPGDRDFARQFAAVELEKVDARWREVLVTLNEQVSSGETAVLGSSKVHVEHILPVNPSQAALREAKVASKKVAAELTGRIGNLTLLKGKFNQEVSNHPFSVKKKKYGQSEIALTLQLAKRRSWTAGSIETRSADLAKLAVKAWPWPTATGAERC